MLRGRRLLIQLFAIPLFAMLLLVSCQQQSVQQVTVFDEGNYPKKLSDWGLVSVDDEFLVVNQQTVFYDLNTPLFSDYAHKLRTVWIPDGQPGQYIESGDIDLPIGSIISKTFYYPRQGDKLLQIADSNNRISDHRLDLQQIRLIETRLLIHQPSGWVGLPYVWDQDQREARLKLTGAQMELAIVQGAESKRFDYVVPDFNQCQGCHVENVTTNAMGLLGFKTRHLNKQYIFNDDGPNQLDYLAERQILEALPSHVSTLPKNADWLDKTVSIDNRARSYLDINCGHCHNPKGAADTSGLFLHYKEADALRLGVCKPPVAAGQGTGGHRFAVWPGKAEDSILLFRMKSLDLGAMMPELGKSLIHQEGVQLIEDWINQQSGGC